MKTGKIVNVKILKNADSYIIDDMEVITGDFGYLPDFEFWKGKESNGCVMSFQHNMLGCFVVYGSLTVIECSDRIINDKMTGGCIEKPEGEILVQLPYFPSGKYANIFDPSGKKVLTIDLSSKATCNENDKCDRPVEDGENCPQDCKKNEPKIDTIVMKLATNNQAAAQGVEKKISLADLGWWGIAILIILLAGGGVGYYVYRRNRNSEQ